MGFMYCLSSGQFVHFSSLITPSLDIPPHSPGMHGLLPPTRWLQCHGAAHTLPVTLQGGEIRKQVKAPLGRSTPAAGGDKRHLQPQGGPANMADVADMATMRLGLGLAAPCGSGVQPASGWGARGSPLIWAVPRQMGGHTCSG